MNNIKSIRQFEGQARRIWSDQDPNQAIKFVQNRLGATKVEMAVEDSDDYETRKQLLGDLKAEINECHDELNEPSQDPRAVERTSNLLDMYQDNWDDVREGPMLIRDISINGVIASEPIIFDDLLNIIRVAWQPTYNAKDLYDIQYRISDLYDQGKINAAMNFLQDCYSQYYINDYFSMDYIDKATASYLLHEDLNDTHTSNDVRHLCAKKLQMVETCSPHMYFKCDDLKSLSVIDKQAMVNAPSSMQKSFLTYVD